MKQKGFAPIIILILIVLVGVGAYYFGTIKNKSVSTPVASVQPSSSPLAKPTANPTANWKTYTNATYGYSIKYPPEITYNVLSNADAEFYMASDKRSENGRTLAPRLSILNRGISTPELVAKNEVGSRSFSQVEFNNTYGVKLDPLAGFDFFDLDYYLGPKSNKNNAVVLRIFIDEFPNTVPQDQRTEFLKTFVQILSTFQFTK